ncbi:MAG: hypothetical protein IPP90_06055 [Gemmatimonadaceae bacterium]|nr:hypothetical protein [Gemmatimonadaceae bacterium]
MSSSRRDFIKKFGAGAALSLYSRDLWTDHRRLPPKGQSWNEVRGLADIVLGEAKLVGCPYADVRFTRTSASRWHGQFSARRRAVALAWWWVWRRWRRWRGGGRGGGGGGGR